MPLPIHKNEDKYELPEVKSQDLSSLIPFLQNPFGLLGSLVYGDDDKKELKEVWINSQTEPDKTMRVSNINLDTLNKLSSKGLLKIEKDNPVIVSLTKDGKKLLNETILSDEKCAVSFTKQASKKLVAKNSYDFGNEVLVKLNHPERYGVKYITVRKESFKGKCAPIEISDYDIVTRNAEGGLRDLSSYSESELIKILHLAKKIIENHHSIRIAGNSIKTVPVHRIRAFSQKVIEELNKR